MPRSLNSPDRLFDRTWRAGHPFRRRLSAGRRWSMVTLFALLAVVIGGYAFVTDSQRVKSMAEEYLSGLLGGRVEVGRATLSIFQGLRLDDVQVYAKRAHPNDEEHALFSADSFLLEYNPATLFSGKLVATEIKAINARVHLTEDVKTGNWSFQRLHPRNPNNANQKPDERPPILPKIFLRNATVEYSQIANGIEGPASAITLEGQFIPADEADTYHFLLQSRGEVEGIGPSVEGTWLMATKEVRMRLRNFVFGQDAKAMLPAQPRKWFSDHQIAGALDADVDYRLSDQHHFRVQVELGGVTAIIHPNEWMSENEITRLRLAQQSLGVLQLAGLNTPARGLTDESFVDHFISTLSPTPLQVDGVAGQFIFTQDGIDIVSGRGRVESNGFTVNGHIGGYSPSSPIHLHITSPTTENLYVAAAPRYVSSMPGPVREIYNRFKPQGICSFWADIERPTPGGEPQVHGELNILDGQFRYEKFTYPVQHVVGKIAVGPDENGDPSVRLEHIRGHGIDGGPNANADFEINGWMAPLGPEVQIHIDVTGHNISTEPALTAAFPSGAQKAVRMFDADGLGDYPRYHGDFAVQVLRDHARKSHWTIATDIHVDDAAGSLVAFPYPLDHVAADVHIQGDRLDVRHATMHRGNASMALDGVVTWGAQANAGASSHGGDDEDHVRPDLHIVAKDVPIDRTLIDALPPDRRQWLQKIGIGGMINVDGTISSPRVQTLANGEPAPLDLNLGIDWRDGKIAPGGDVFATGMSGKLQLQPQRLIISDIKGQRGDAQLSARGTVSWPTEPPQIMFSAEASNLLLDKKLYELLPVPARKGWDAVHPQGTIDASVQFSGPVGESPTTRPTTPGASADSASGLGYQVTIVPRSLSATVDAAPYKLDHLSGTLTVQPDLIDLKDIVGHHGDAIVHVSGTGIGKGSSSAWDLRLTGEHMLIDNDLRHAAPTALAGFLKSMEMQGTINFDFSKLSLAPSSAARPASTSSPALASNEDSSDVNFAVRISSSDASMNVGVQLQHVKGIADLAGDTHGGSLHQLAGAIEAESLSMAD
ncbi:MAG: hypothetical protein JO353_06950, partial [Phycisphaerae bacterium]|nr:hypothetical protein [Phycisphaerae bacterium]